MNLQFLAKLLTNDTFFYLVAFISFVLLLSIMFVVTEKHRLGQPWKAFPFEFIIHVIFFVLFFLSCPDLFYTILISKDKSLLLICLFCVFCLSLMFMHFFCIRLNEIRKNREKNQQKEG